MTQKNNAPQLPVEEAPPGSNGKFHPSKPRAIEVQLDDGQIVYVHEPRMRDMGIFLRSLPALNAIARAFEVAQNASDGVIGMSVDIPDTAYEGLFPLVAIMTDITVDEFKDMALFDGLKLMRAFAVFAPKNPQAVATT